MSDDRILQAGRESLSRLLDLTQAGDDADLPEPDHPAQAAPTPGPTHVPGYRIVRELNRGGQGVVFQAVQESTGRKVAVKLLRDGPLAGPNERARLLREVQVLAALNHPNIVSVIDRGETPGGYLYLVMEYVAGKPLDRHLGLLNSASIALGSQSAPGSAGDSAAASAAPPAAGPEKLESDLRLFLKVCDAVATAHVRGIVHRDLKPSNILVDEDGEPHVLDFGLARAGLGPLGGDDGTSPVTATGQFVGSLPWASPEQAEGSASKIDVRTDVYSLGVILYQILTGGHFPYKVTGTMLEVLQSIQGGRVTPPSQVLSASAARSARRGMRRHLTRSAGGVAPALEAIALKALATRREGRFQSAGELARAIEGYLSGRPGPSSRAGRGRRALVLGAAAAMACMAVGAAVWLARPGQESSARGADGQAHAAVGEGSPGGSTGSATESPPKPRVEVRGEQGDERLRFTAARSIAVESSPAGLVASDLDGDGKLDLAVSHANWRQRVHVSVLRGRGDGTFDTPVGYHAGLDLAGELTAADLNGDGRADLVLCHEWDDRFRFAVLLNRGDGSFAPPRLHDAPGVPRYVAAADFDHDGRTDLAFAIGRARGHEPLDKQQGDFVSVLRGRGDGTFGPPGRAPLGQPHPVFVLAHDLTGDAHVDLVTCHTDGPNFAPLTFVPGDGRGGFGAPVRLDGLGVNPAWLSVADFDADGIPDLAFGEGGTANVGVLRGLGGGRFDKTFVRGIDALGRALTVADLNGDGKLDLIAPRRPKAAVAILFGRGDATFDEPPVNLVTTPAPEGRESGPARIAAADFNGDGRIDLVTTDWENGTISVLLNAR